MPEPREFSSLTPEEQQVELDKILNQLHNYIGIHEVVFDEFHSIVDAKLVWHNEAYGKVRLKPVEIGQSMAETYFESHIALGHVAEAWSNGRSFQFFELSPSTRDRYRTPGSRVAILVNWSRHGDRILEVGTDVSESMAVQEMLNNHKSLAAIASKRRALAVERERIARNLHDNVIQQLYATSLSLSMVINSADEKMQPVLQRALESMDKVVGDIRREILDVESRNASPVWRQLEDSLVPVLEPTGVELDIDIPAIHVDEEFMPHLRAVSMEATSNAVRHGGAGMVWVKLRRKGEFLELSIADNGSGIAPDSVLQNGLKNMSDRAHSLGGTMQIDARTGGGTIITWSVPYLEKETKK